MTNEALANCLSEILNSRRKDFANSYNTMACGERIVYYEPHSEQVFWIEVSSLADLINDLDSVDTTRLSNFFEESRNIF